MRAKTAKLTRSKKIIEWRSHEPSRLETFSDAVFAFAVTLIIVSLEVPKNFADLAETLKGTASFAVCFSLLFMIWNNQNLFFRYYGLRDGVTVALNAALLFVVLVYVYPLKFLFNVMFLNNQYKVNGHLTEMISDRDTPTLMMIYGLGYIAINMLFYFMYRIAVKHRVVLKLKPLELFETKTIGNMYMVCSFIGVLSIFLGYTLSPQYRGFSGLLYILIGPAHGVWFSYRGRKQHKLFGPAEIHHT